MHTLCMQCAQTAMTAGDHGKSRQHVEVVPLSKTSQDGDGGGDAGLVHIHLLEAALKGRVLLNVLAVLIQGGGADAPQLATTQHGLQQIACTSKQASLQSATHQPGAAQHNASLITVGWTKLPPPRGGGVKRVVKRGLGRGMVPQQEKH